MRTITIRVDGVPIAEPRKRCRSFGKGVHLYTPKNHPVTAWKQRIKMAVTQQFLCLDHPDPFSGPLQCRLHFRMPRPKHLTWKTKVMEPLPHFKKPDIDNLAKAVFDSLNGSLWHDDSQVVDLRAGKVVTDSRPPGVEIYIAELPIEEIRHRHRNSDNAVELKLCPHGEDPAECEACFVQSDIC